MTTPTTPPAIPVARLRGLIQTLWPCELTPQAKRQLEQLCAAYDDREELCLVTGSRHLTDCACRPDK